MTWLVKVMLHISISVSSAWTHLWCFHRSSLSPSNVIAEKLLVTFHDLKWPWRHGKGSLVAIFWFSVSILLVTWCLRVFRMIFVQTRRLSVLSHWHNEHNGRKIDLTLGYLHISKLWDRHVIGSVTDINRWKLQGDWSFGVAMTSIKICYEVRSLDVTWWPDLEWSGSEIFIKCAKKMYKQLCLSAKNLSRVFKHPRPGAG